MKNTIIGFVAVSILLTVPIGQAESSPTEPPESETARPNIVFILADDLGYGDLGCYGQTKIQTPQIDTLASEGLLFTQVYSGSTVCSPSRSALMTGQHTGHTRVRNNSCPVGGIEGEKGDKAIRRMHLTDDDLTVAHVLKSAGYRTAIIGKWHLGGFDPGAGPLERGFDEFYGTLTRSSAATGAAYWPTQWFTNADLLAVPENAHGARGRYRTDMVTDAAIAFMERSRAEPFFLYVAFNAPHSPYRPPDLGPYAGGSWAELEAAYAAMIHHLDRSVGRLMASLNELGLADNTMVFFTSDNGPRSENKDIESRVVDFFNSNGPLRGFKRDLTDGGIRVPMIVRWPGVVPAGASSETVWYFADFLPTAAELAGAAAPEGIDGISMVAAIKDPERRLPDRFLYWEFPGRRLRQAVRWKNWKAIRDGIDGQLRLYDVTTDVAEERDVAADNPQVVAAIVAYLETARTDSPNWPIRQELNQFSFEDNGSALRPNSNGPSATDGGPR